MRTNATPECPASHGPVCGFVSQQHARRSRLWYTPQLCATLPSPSPLPLGFQLFYHSQGRPLLWRGHHTGNQKQFLIQRPLVLNMHIYISTGVVPSTGYDPSLSPLVQPHTRIMSFPSCYLMLTFVNLTPWSSSTSPGCVQVSFLLSVRQA